MHGVWFYTSVGAPAHLPPLPHGWAETLRTLHPRFPQRGSYAHPHRPGRAAGHTLTLARTAPPKAGDGCCAAPARARASRAALVQLGQHDRHSLRARPAAAAVSPRPPHISNYGKDLCGWWSIFSF